jgi:CheY-like chemotaxis protein
MKPPATSHHVLIVEDDVWFAASAKRTLEAHGYHVDWAPGAQEAAEMVAAKRPDLIVLDIFLPEANGLQLLHELRGYDDSFDVPVIVCSGSVHDIPAQALDSYGVLSVLDKTTLTPAQLAKSVGEVLRK